MLRISPPPRRPYQRNLERYIDAYLHRSGIADDGDGLLFHTAPGHGGELTESPMIRFDVYRMTRRCTLTAGLVTRSNCHTFRAKRITAYLSNGGILEHAQRIANHETSRTMKLCDRAGDEVTLDEIEKIVLQLVE